jgi:hypothetical protein
MAENDDKPQDVGGGWILPRCISLSLVLTPLFGAALVLGALLWVGVPGIYRSLVPNEQGLLPAAEKELVAARAEHKAIVRIAAVCTARQTVNAETIADEPFLRIDFDQPHDSNLIAVHELTELPGYFDAALYLSYEIGKARSQLAGKAVVQHLVEQVFEWTIIVSGLFTTVLLSVKAFTGPRSRDYLLMAVTAIGLSAFSTAVATLNSFYSPRNEYEKTEHALASLRTLHWTLAAGITREKHACDAKAAWTDWRATHIRDLANSFVAVMSATARPPTLSEDEPGEPDLTAPVEAGDVSHVAGGPRPQRNPS